MDSVTVGLAILAVVLLVYYMTLFNPSKLTTMPQVPFFQSSFLAQRNQHRFSDLFHDFMTANKTKTAAMKVLFQPPIVFTSCPKNVKYMLLGISGEEDERYKNDPMAGQQWKNFPKGPEVHKRFVELLGDGIFNVDGDEWKKIRKTSSHGFSENGLKTMVPVFDHHAAEIVSHRLETLKKNEVFDMQNIFLRFTLDSMGEVGFGTEFNSLNSENPFAEVFDFCQSQATHRFFEPFWRMREAFTPSGWKFHSSLKQLDKFAYQIVADRRAQHAEDIGSSKKKSRTDLLAMFMDKDTGASDGKPMFDDKFLRDMVMNFLIAGRDTTANALSWAFYEVARHPEVHAKMVKEIDEMYAAAEARGAERGPDGQVKLEHVDVHKGLPYTQSVLDEALRLHPSVPQDGKWCEKGATLPDGSVLPPKSWLFFFPYGMGRDEDIWGPDAAQFNPDRWASLKKSELEFKYPVFQAGPRRCLGMGMAWLEAKTAMAHLYRRYSFKLSPEQKEVKYALSITLIMETPGLLMTCAPRPGYAKPQEEAGGETKKLK